MALTLMHKAQAAIKTRVFDMAPRALTVDDLPGLLAVQHACYGEGFVEGAEGFARPDTLYLHDMAVLPALAGRGLARALLEPLWHQAIARGLRRSALVSVQGSQGFWERHGYAAQPLHDAAQRQRLAAYGEGAVYMVRGLEATLNKLPRWRAP